MVVDAPDIAVAVRHLVRAEHGAAAARMAWPGSSGVGVVLAQYSLTAVRNAGLRIVGGGRPTASTGSAGAVDGGLADHAGSRRR